MYRLFLLCLFLWCSTPSCVDVATAQPSLVSAIPVLKISNVSEIQSLQIDKLKVEIQVTANIATTTFDITFYNPLDRILEGEFDFPLADGQNISRYALEIEDKLREGVVVEKATARVAFDNIVRRKVDPGLVEKTKGNNFRTRVYPIPAKGYKRIVIGIEQSLDKVEKGLLYQLPLYADYKIREINVQALVGQSMQKPIIQENGLPEFSFDKSSNDWQAVFEANNFSPAHNVSFVIPVDESEPVTLTENYEGTNYFYSYIPLPFQIQPKALPASATILWDVSASSASRNIKNELELLRKYLSQAENISVTVIPFNIGTYPALNFKIINGKSTELLKYLAETEDFDGGTQLGSLDLTQYHTDDILLFSDGLSTFGQKEIHLSAKAVMAITSSPGADYSYLKYVALQTKGKFIDLNTMNADKAGIELANETMQFIRADYDGMTIKELVTPVNTSLQYGLSLAGKISKPSATVTLHFGYGSNITFSKTIQVDTKQAPTINIRRIWATMQINQLDLQFEKNKDAITQCGKKFSIVTQNTSLLVLDRIEDYVEYEIEPPVEMQKVYYVLLQEKLKNKEDDTELAFKDAVSEMTELKSWWSFSRSRKKLSAVTVARFTPLQTVADSDGDGIANTYSYNFGTVDSAAASGFAANASGALAAPMYKAEEQNKAIVQDVSLENIREPKLDEKPDATDAEGRVQIELSQWKPDAPYLVQLEKTAPNERFKKYIALKKQYIDQPSFFIEVARFFHAKQNKPLALQVLSNITEMKLENAELLRNVADQLIEFGQTGLALSVYEEICKIREEEPQAYRDLALAYNEAGQYDKAVHLLYKVATGTWSNRFGDVRSIALNEMNAIISAHPGDVNTAGIKKQFISPMPVDVRIVISWNTDNSDIDLWVNEPTKEKCDYQNNSTKIGGRLSKDATQGFGPEEYSLKKAVNGDFVIEANLYGDTRQTLGGPITIKAELFTDFGRPNQKRKVINVRVTDNKEVAKIGSLHFQNN